MKPDMRHEENDGTAVMVFRLNSIPKTVEFYPIAGMLSDGTVKAITENYKRGLERWGDRRKIANKFNNGMYATAPFSDEEATKIFEKSNFKF
jgi:hypothetical protein